MAEDIAKEPNQRGKDEGCGTTVKLKLLNDKSKLISKIRTTPFLGRFSGVSDNFFLLTNRVHNVLVGGFNPS